MKTLTAKEFMESFSTGRTEETPQEYVESMMIAFARMHLVNYIMISKDNKNFPIDNLIK